jgi:polyamine oxidase
LLPKSDGKKSYSESDRLGLSQLCCLSRVFQGSNFTYNRDQGGFSTENLLTIDQRGFATIIQSQAAEFLSEEQVQLNATVKAIHYSNNGVSVSLTDGTNLSADYALVTFSLGVLQHDEVVFKPALPQWKLEAIHGMAMVSRLSHVIFSPSYSRGQGTYTKIYLQFPQKFWFNTEVLGSFFAGR